MEIPEPAQRPSIQAESSILRLPIGAPSMMGREISSTQWSESDSDGGNMFGEESPLPAPVNFVVRALHSVIFCHFLFTFVSVGPRRLPKATLMLVRIVLMKMNRLNLPIDRCQNLQSKQTSRKRCKIPLVEV